MMDNLVWIFVSALVVNPTPGVETPGYTPSPLRGWGPAGRNFEAALGDSWRQGHG